MKKIKTAKSFMIRLRLLNLRLSPSPHLLHALPVLYDLLIPHVYIHLSSVQVIVETIHHLSLLRNHRRQSLKNVPLRFRRARSPTNSVMCASMSCTACARSCK